MSPQIRIGPVAMKRDGAADGGFTVPADGLTDDCQRVSLPQRRP